jgi:hypothetical protein
LADSLGLLNRIILRKNNDQKSNDERRTETIREHVDWLTNRRHNKLSMRAHRWIPKTPSLIQLLKAIDDVEGGKKIPLY